MKSHYLILLVLLALLAIPVTAQQPIELVIMKNEGLSQYSNTNYTFDCEDARSNILTIIVPQVEGYSYLIISYQIETAWIDAYFEVLDTFGDTSVVQFNADGLYRLSINKEFNESSTHKDFYVNVIGGNGTYAAGGVEGLIAKGKWVEDMEFVFDKPWPFFKDWGYRAFRFFDNPAYMLTDFLIEIPMFLLIPHTWLIMGVVVLLLLWRLNKRIKTSQKDRQLSKTHGTREDLIREKRRAQEEERLHKLNTMPIDYALEKYGSGDYLSRSLAYHIGSPELGVTYPSAYAIAFELGGALYSKNEKRAQRAQLIVESLVEQHEPTLEKAYIYQDIAACARAVSSESVDPRARTVIKDNFILIAEMAEDDARSQTEELSQKLKIRKRDTESLTDVITKVEKKLRKKEKGGKPVGKESKSS